MFESPDWSSIFAPGTPLLELVVRGSLMYLALFGLLRVLRREPGAVSIADILVVVLLADASQNGIAGQYESVTDGIILVAVILFWSHFIDWLGFHVPFIGNIVHPPPLELVRDGVELWRNMRRELISHEELMTQLRQQGIDDLSRVKRAFLEGNGQISFVTEDESTNPGPKKRLL